MYCLQAACEHADCGDSHYLCLFITCSMHVSCTLLLTICDSYIYWNLLAYVLVVTNIVLCFAATHLDW